MPYDELITRPRSPTVRKITIKLKNQKPGSKGAVDPVKRKSCTAEIDLRNLVSKQEVLGGTNGLLFFLNDIDHKENDASNNVSVVACICSSGKNFTKPLSCNNTDTQTDCRDL
jgi:hypothetical protein